MAFVDESKGEWRCVCSTPGDPSALDLSAHDADAIDCARCGARRPSRPPMISKPWCGECNPNPNNKRPKCLQGLCADCLAKVEPLSEAEIQKAFEEGRQARADAEAEIGMRWPDVRWGWRIR